MRLGGEILRKAWRIDEAKRVYRELLPCLAADALQKGFGNRVVELLDRLSY